jgi:hypothetical protein
MTSGKIGEQRRRRKPAARSATRGREEDPWQDRRPVTEKKSSGKIGDQRQRRRPAADQKKKNAEANAAPAMRVQRNEILWQPAL